MSRYQSSESMRQVDSNAVCRTCKTCRRKKVKCEGQHPKCSTCRASGCDCEYPQDGRKTAVRTRKADVRSLQRQIEELKGQLSERMSTNSSSNADSIGLTRDWTDSSIPVNVPHDISLASSYQQDYRTRALDFQDISPPQREEQRSLPVPSLGQVQEPADGDRVSSPEPNTEGGEIQIYGGTSLLHNHSSGEFWSNAPPTGDETERFLKSATQDHLLSRATLSRQKEIILCSNPSMAANIDFDGVPMDMAMHLLDLHWSRLHLIYLLTYRPAIMDSLVNNGPYVSKLLLNAIYLQSSLYSDRKFLQIDAQDPQTTGMGFYNRFKTLLVECIDQPNMPTVVALLICGACLVPYGKQNAGWVYSGMAYRMMLDLGYHLNIPNNPEKGAKFGLSATDIEIRRRVYWGAYVSDKFQSLWLGRSPAVRESDSNTPQEYLDSYEEMAEWKPYTDPQAQPLNPGVLSYCRPTYALSTFQCLLRLSVIAAQVIDNFYSVKSAKMRKSVLLQTRREMIDQLGDWNHNLPTHLRFDPDKDDTPPPHQLHLHTTYWTLIILIEQAFLNGGQFDFALDRVSQERSRKNCVEAALKIWRLLEGYQKAFSLRHAHYGEFYAAYSAVLVILQQAHQNHEEYIDCIKFFWYALSGPQRGFTGGLKKPFRLLKSLIRRIKPLAQQFNVDEPENTTVRHASSVFPAWPDSVLGWEAVGPANTDAWAHPGYNTVTDDTFFTDYTMFGLFT